MYTRKLSDVGTMGVVGVVGGYGGVGVGVWGGGLSRYKDVILPV